MPERAKGASSGATGDPTPSGSAPGPPEDDTTGTSRREFLRAGGFAAAGLVVGGGAGAAAGAVIGRSAGYEEGAAEYGALNPRRVPGFEHVVVMMGENRSFDNLLGWLYTPDTLPEGETFDGLAFGDYGNVDDNGRRVAAHVYSGDDDDIIMGSPNPDPGEEYPHVNTQIFGSITPASNRDLAGSGWAAPYNAPAPGEVPTMAGFLTDYHINARRLHRKKSVGPEVTDQIMGSFSPEQLPVLSTLAKEFAVFDAWFGAVPSQTYCNRSFFHASTSHGFVTNKHNGGYGKWLDASPTPTVFNRLEEAGIPWKIYFDELQLVSLTGVMHAPVLQKYWRTKRFAHMSQFWEDVRNGELPAYSFIEPRLVYNHNDFHPPFGVFRSGDLDGTVLVDSAVSDVRSGERLVADIYEAIKHSGTQEGSNSLNTLFLITFDEHGGTYDHVPPPTATPPTAGADAGEMGFTFDRLGPRVPVIAVSAYTRAGTIIHDEMHHGAVIATLSRLYGLRPLTRRDAGANDLFSVTNLQDPRAPETWPDVHPLLVPPLDTEDNPGDLKAGAHRNKPLSNPGRGLLGLLRARYAPNDDDDPQTYADAYRILREHGLGLFYPKID